MRTDRTAGEPGALEPGNRNAAFFDDDPLAPADTFDEGAQPVLGLCNTGSFHMAKIACLKDVFKAVSPPDGRKQWCRSGGYVPHSWTVGP